MPVVSLAFDGQQASYFKHASDAQLDWISPVSGWGAEEADCRIAIWADTNTRELSNVAPERQTLRRDATRDLMADDDEALLRGRAPLGRDDVSDQRPRGRRRDEPRATSRTSTTAPASPTTPIRSGAWKRASEECHRLAEWIEGREEVRIVAEGTDLTLGIAGRHFIPCDGEHNMPDGEFFTGPIEDSVEGEVTFHLPATIGGREVAGVRLRFEAGKVVDATAERGEEYLISMLDTDEGARRLGELGIGTNFGIEHGHPLDPARREDRRHDPPRGGRQLSRVRRRQRERRPHGHGLRPAPGRTARGRRRSAAGGRRLRRLTRSTSKGANEAFE